MKPHNRSNTRMRERKRGADGNDMRASLLDSQDESASATDTPPPLLADSSSAVGAASSGPSVSVDVGGDGHPPLLSVGVICLCVAGFLMSFKPSEPFLTNYLIDVKGMTDPIVSDKIYPVWTYSYLAFLLPAGILSHAFGARTVAAIGFAARLATRGILLWGEGIPAMQAMQVTFGLASACEPAFYSCAYAALPRKYFQRVTGAMQGAMLAGHLAAGLIGQSIVSSGADLRILFIISAISVTLATIVYVACATLPQMNIHYHLAAHAPPSSSPSSGADEEAPTTTSIELREQNSDDTSQEATTQLEEGDEDQESWIEIIRQRGFKSLLSLLFSEFSRPGVILWCIFWWFGQGVTELVLNYNTTLFYERAPDLDYDGVVIACGRGAAALTSLLPLLTGTPQGTRAAGMLSGLNLTGALVLLLSALLTSVYAAYGLFIAYYAIMQFVYSMAMSAVAASVSRGHRTLIFTANAFVSLVFQTCTQVTIGHEGLHLSGHNKFFVMSTQLAGVGVIFLFITIASAIYAARQHGRTEELLSEREAAIINDAANTDAAAHQHDEDIEPSTSASTTFLTK